MVVELPVDCLVALIARNVLTKKKRLNDARTKIMVTEATIVTSELGGKGTTLMRNI